MKKEYSKPELIDLNEQTGLGNSGCRNGSGANTPGCISGNVARGTCNNGVGNPN